MALLTFLDQLYLFNTVCEDFENVTVFSLIIFPFIFLAFIGALYVDKDLTWVERFCQVCFWPRLVEFILKQEWNDAKSKLQQCCLTFRSLNEDPEIAHYKVLTYFSFFVFNQLSLISTLRYRSLLIVRLFVFF